MMKVRNNLIKKLAYSVHCSNYLAFIIMLEVRARDVGYQCPSGSYFSAPELIGDQRQVIFRKSSTINNVLAKKC